MQTIKKSKKVNKKALLSAVALVLLSGLTAFAYMQSTNLPTPADGEVETITEPDYSPPTDEQVDAGQDIVDDAVKNPEPSADPRPTTGSVEVEITALNQTDTYLQIRTMIQTLQPGTCSLTVTKGSDVVTRTAGSQALANSSSCKGFNIPLNELSPGEWTVDVKFNNPELSGSVTDRITIR